MSRQRATVTSKGQITIPREVRRRLALETGDQVDFVVDGSRTVIYRVRGQAEPFETYIGALPSFGTKRQINAWLRNLRDAPSRRK
jgi:antitoxin PrlF